MTESKLIEITRDIKKPYASWAVFQNGTIFSSLKQKIRNISVIAPVHIATVQPFELKDFDVRHLWKHDGWIVVIQDYQIIVYVDSSEVSKKLVTPMILMLQKKVDYKTLWETELYKQINRLGHEKFKLDQQYKKMIASYNGN